MSYVGFVVAMAAEIGIGTYERPYHLHRSRKEWLIVARFAPKIPRRRRTCVGALRARPQPWSKAGHCDRSAEAHVSPLWPMAARPFAEASCSCTSSPARSGANRC